MAISLQDPTRQRDPSSRHAFPDILGEPALRARRTLAEDLLDALSRKAAEHAREDVAEAHVAGATG